MSTLEILYLVLSFISLFSCIGVTQYLFRTKHVNGHKSLAATFFLLSIWIAAQLLSLIDSGDQWLLFWTNIRFFPLAFVPVTWFFFALAFFSQSQNFSKRTVTLLLLPPLFTQLMVWTNPVHHLFLLGFQSGYFRNFHIITGWQFGPAFWFHTTISYFLMFFSLVLIIHAATKFMQLYRRQSILLILSAIFPLAITVLHTFHIIPIYLDLTPLVFSLSGIIIMVNIYTFHFGDIRPIEKERLIEFMRDGMIIINNQHAILEINDSAIKLLHSSHAQTIGKNLIKLFPFIHIPDINEREIYEIEPKIGDEIKQLEVITSPIQRQGQINGWVIILRDTTEIALVEMAYKDIERRFNKVIMNSHEGIVIVDDTGKIIVWNQAIEGMLLAKRSDVLNKYIWDIIPLFTYRHNIPLKNLQIIEDEIKKGLSTGKSIMFDLPVEISLQAQNKSQRFAEFIVYPIKAGNGYYICFNCHEITDQVEARIILQEANITLEREVQERTAELENLMNSLEKRIKDRTKDLSILYLISASANQNLQIEDMLNNALILILDALQASSGSIHIYDKETNSLSLIAHRNLDRDFLRSIKILPVENNIFGRVITENNTITSPDLSYEKDQNLPYPKTFESESMTYTGNLMRAKGINLGVLSIFQPSSKHFSVEQIALLTTISEQLGVAIENHRLQKKSELVAVIQERARLARDLHDSVNQRLYSQILYSSAAIKAYNNQNIDKAKAHLEKIDQNAQLALREMRLLIHELRPDPLEEEGFIGAITQRLEFVEKRAGVNYKINIDGELDLSKEEERELFSIITEALNNALKHANASKILINIISTKPYFRLEICDNGIGFEINTASKQKGLGITSMKERAEKIGGSFCIQSFENNYTCVIIEIGQSQFKCDIKTMEGKFND
jgi:two-component system NarL family sensor kinase